MRGSHSARPAASGTVASLTTCTPGSAQADSKRSRPRLSTCRTAPAVQGKGGVAADRCCLTLPLLLSCLLRLTALALHDSLAGRMCSVEQIKGRFTCSGAGPSECTLAQREKHVFQAKTAGSSCHMRRLCPRCRQRDSLAICRSVCVSGTMLRTLLNKLLKAGESRSL